MVFDPVEAGLKAGSPPGWRPHKALVLEHELLHAAAVGSLSHVEIASIVDAHPMRTKHLPGLVSAAAKFADDLQVGPPQDPDLMVGSIGHIQPLLLRVGRQDGYECRAGRERRGG